MYIQENIGVAGLGNVGLLLTESFSISINILYVSVHPEPTSIQTSTSTSVTSAVEKTGRISNLYFLYIQSILDSLSYIVDVVLNSCG